MGDPWPFGQIHGWLTGWLAITGRQYGAGSHIDDTGKTRGVRILWVIHNKCFTLSWVSWAGQGFSAALVITTGG